MSNDRSASAGEGASVSVSNGRYKWAVVGMLWLICFFNYADRQAIYSIYPLLKKDLGLSDPALGLIAAVFTWVYAVSAPWAGQVGDNIVRKAVIIGGLWIWSAISGLTSLATNYWQLLIIRGSEGLGETFYFPASMSLISDYHAKPTRSRAMGIHQTSVYVGTVGGGALAGWMGERYGWQSPFILLAACGIILGFILTRWIKEPLRGAAERFEIPGNADIGAPKPMPICRFLRELMLTPTAVLLLLGFFGANFVALVFLTWFPTFLNEKFHLTLALSGITATIYIQFASLIGAAVGGVLADRWRQRRASGRIGVQAVGLFLGAPFIFLCSETRELTTLIVAMSLFGFFKGMYDSNIFASLYDVVSISRRGTAAGLMNMIGWLGGGLGALMIGIYSPKFGMSAAIASTAGVYLVVAVILLAAMTFAANDTHKAQLEILR